MAASLNKGYVKGQGRLLRKGARDDAAHRIQSCEQKEGDAAGPEGVFLDHRTGCEGAMPMPSVRHHLPH